VIGKVLRLEQILSVLLHGVWKFVLCIRIEHDPRLRWQRDKERLMPLFGVHPVTKLVQHGEFVIKERKETKLAIRTVQQQLGLVDVQCRVDCEVVRLRLVQLILAQQGESLRQQVALLFILRGLPREHVQLLRRVRDKHKFRGRQGVDQLVVATIALSAMLALFCVWVHCALFPLLLLRYLNQRVLCRCHGIRISILHFQKVTLVPRNQQCVEIEWVNRDARHGQIA